MGLDDIAKRNKRTELTDGLSGLAASAVNKLGKDEVVENKPFTLPSQRRSGTVWWKVLIFMVVVGVPAGWYACHQADRDMELDQMRHSR